MPGHLYHHVKPKINPKDMTATRKQKQPLRQTQRKRNGAELLLKELTFTHPQWHP